MASARASAGRGEAAIVLALTALLTIVSLLPPGGAAAAGGLAALALTVIAWMSRAPGASSLGLLFVTCLALALTGFGPQQVVFGMAFVLYAVVVFRVAWFREATFGSPLAASTDASLLGVLPSPRFRRDVTLVVRHGPSRSRRSRPDVHPRLAALAVDPCGVRFLRRQCGRRGSRVPRGRARCAGHGGGHSGRGVGPAGGGFCGVAFPGGFSARPAGVALTFVYGLVLGELRRRAGGLLVPFITHVLTDLVIVTIVLALVRT